jgi:DMSO/TMAO reductase YedYZ heme-binding membrane subunit
VRRRVAPVIYACSLLLSGAVLLTSAHTLPAFHETQWYAGLGFAFLYLTLVVGPLGGVPRLASGATGTEARRALGVSACYFALLHSYFGFYRFVGGFAGLRYWSSYFAWSLLAGLLALVLLCTLAVASLPWLVRRMGRYWKPTQRLLYVAAVLILIHGVTVTIHLTHLRAILIVTYVLLVVLLALELRRVDRYLTRPHGVRPANLATLVGLPTLSVLLFWAFFFLDHHTH